MPVVVVIIIVAAWAVILGPSLFKRRVRTGGDQSISHFHYQLRVLEQRAPEPIVAPAYRLRAVDGNGTPTSIHYPETGRPPVLTVVGAKELPRPALAFLGEPEVSEPAAGDDRTAQLDRGAGHEADLYRVPPVTDPAPVMAPGPPTVTAPRGPDVLSRAQARRRRQDTLTILGAVFIVTLMAAVLTGSAFVWAVVALDGVALGAYVGVLVHLRRMAAERDRKLHYLDPRADRPDRAEVPRTYMSGRYAHPSNQQAVAR
ncbi:MAG TPA: hypothetical protein VF320_07280 [Acidimicrobiales bacterium]